MARDWVETHTTEDSDILKGVAEFTRQDDKVPEASPSSVVRFIETTSRIDGPFGSGRQYVISTDLFEDFVEPPAPPPTAEENRLFGLETAKAANATALDNLIDSDETQWGNTEITASLHSLLREQKIQELKKKLGKP